MDVVLADRADQLVHRAQQVLRVERRGHERVELREIGRAAGGERGEELGVEVAPAERLLPHLEAGELALELRDARVLDRLDGLRLDLGVPDLELAHLLAERGGRAAERDGAEGGGGAGEEATTGDARRRCVRVGHQSCSFRGAFVGLSESAGVRRERCRVYSARVGCQAHGAQMVPLRVVEVNGCDVFTFEGDKIALKSSYFKTRT